MHETFFFCPGTSSRTGHTRSTVQSAQTSLAQLLARRQGSNSIALHCRKPVGSGWMAAGDGLYPLTFTRCVLHPVWHWASLFRAAVYVLHSSCCGYALHAVLFLCSYSFWQRNARQYIDTSAVELETSSWCISVSHSRGKRSAGHFQVLAGLTHEILNIVLLTKKGLSWSLCIIVHFYSNSWRYVNPDLIKHAIRFTTCVLRLI